MLTEALRREIFLFGLGSKGNFADLQEYYERFCERVIRDADIKPSKSSTMVEVTATLKRLEQ